MEVSRRDRFDARQTVVWASVAALACGGAGLLAIATSSTPSITVGGWFREPFLIGVSLLAAGIAGSLLRPDSRIGPLLCVAAALSWLPYLQDADVAPIASVGYALREVWIAVPIVILLTYPNGEATRFERVVAALAFIHIMIPNLATALLLRLPPPLGNRSFFSVADDPLLVSRMNHITDTYTGRALGAAIAVLLLARVARGSRVSRAAALPILIAGGVTLVYFTFRDFTCNASILAWTEGADTLAHAAIPLAFLAALARGRVAKGRMGGLLIDIGDRPTGGALRDALARALGDPTLAIAYRIASEDRWVDPDGAPVDLDAFAGTHAVSYLERDGEAVAALIHDPALRDEPERLEPVRRAVRLLLDNERLTAEVRSQLAEVRASRKRILEAADAARARVQRDLHDGAQQRLVALALNLRLAQRAAEPETALLLDEAARELESAVQELRELSQGLHPSVLTESGLRVAVEAAARRSPVPLALDVTVTGRYPEAVEATAYFVVTEGLANMAKHANAAVGQVTIFETPGSLWVEVRDDGVGGAAIERGSGLRGLRDRVEAVGGTLVVETSSGTGTRLAAQIPIGLLADPESAVEAQRAAPR